MRRKERELNIFSMSALDLFASALGAFILVTLILMPYYKKQTPEPVTCPEPAPQPECPVCPAPQPPCEPQIIKMPVVMDKLLMVQMWWARQVDIDLHVKTPHGEYYYGRTIIPGKPGQMAADDTNGSDSSKPATEIWVTFEPAFGVYEVCFHYYGGSGATEVWGTLHKPSGPVTLHRGTLNYHETQCVAKFRVGENFQVEIL